MAKHDYYEILGVQRTALGRRDQEGVPKAGPAVPSRQEPGQQGGGGEVQGGRGGVRGPRRPARSGSATTSSDTKECAGPISARSPTSTTSSAPSATSSAAASAARSSTRCSGGRDAAQRRGGSGTGTPGSDLKIRLKLTLEEIATGVEKKLKIKKWKPCDTCGGTGRALGSVADHLPASATGPGKSARCPARCSASSSTSPPARTAAARGASSRNPARRAHGDGRVQGETHDQGVTSPRASAKGTTSPCAAKETSGKRGGPAGDIIVVIEEEPHPRLHAQRGRRDPGSPGQLPRSRARRGHRSADADRTRDAARSSPGRSRDGSSGCGRRAFRTSTVTAAATSSSASTSGSPRRLLPGRSRYSRNWATPQLP